MVNNIAVQTELTMLKVAILAAAWKEGEKDPAWVKRASDGKFSKNGGGASTANPEEEKGESTKERLRSLSDKAKAKAGELGDKAKSKASELVDKAKDTGADIGNSISKTLEKMGLKEEKALSPETSDLVGKLLKPDSLSTPEKRDEIADNIEDIYDDLMEGWENSPPEAKMALGGLLAVASFVAMHSAMKPLAKVAEGAMQVEKSSKKLNQVNSVISKSLRESLDTDIFTDFYKKLSASTGSSRTQKEFTNRQNLFGKITDLEREARISTQRLEDNNKRIKEVRQMVSDRVAENIDVATGKKYRDPVTFSREQSLENMIGMLNTFERNAAADAANLGKHNKALQNIRAEMYRQAEKAASKPNASKYEKDLLTALDEKIARMSKEAKEADFGKRTLDVGKFKGPVQRYTDESMEGVDKIMEALPNAAGAIAGMMVGAEYSMKAIESAFSQISKQEKS